MAIRISDERELRELGLAIDPKDPSRAVPIQRSADDAKLQTGGESRGTRILLTIRIGIAGAVWILRPVLIGMARLVLLLFALLDLCVAKLTHHATIKANGFRRRARTLRRKASRWRNRR